MNESGYSFVETILAMGILMLLCSSLLPITYTMKTNLTNKKIEMIAAETAYEGLKLFQAIQQTEGTRIIEQVEYQWGFHGGEICVRFHNILKQRQKCISLTGNVNE
ncbi:hypothetical protein [Lysinibacillus fusiformis]|uniref:hypothetical protein n=1 Tax=Lysinibacillus fusiformis TaxID=28031 RepID=UPI001882658A|nr:hypothetical protein [Lysinibacillus fusiformis]MBD8521986.1 hypothetical protein [Lysinibacillus fusiformis]MED4885746.1 hypothetical protein [Lysinibacillus fusiformis]